MLSPLLASDEETRTIPRKDLIDQDVGVPDHHEIDFHPADDTAGNQRAHVSHENVVFVFAHAIIHLYEELGDIRIFAARRVQLE